MADVMRKRLGAPLLIIDAMLAANAHLYGGHLTVRDVTGYARQRALNALASTDKIIGLSEIEVDATGKANRENVIFPRISCIPGSIPRSFAR